MFKQRIKNSLAALLLACLSPLQAASLSDSVLEIPKGTLFELRHELEIPANRDFILLGYNRLSESFNQINQSYNRQNGKYYFYHDYLVQWQESTRKSYGDCVERHRVYYRHGGTSASNSTIISQGNGNTNVIINNQSDSIPTYGSYQGDNSCIKPEQTIAVLLLDADESGGGGAFREGYQFKVKSVRQERRGGFNMVSIRFDHAVAKGIRIISSQSLENIRISHLQYRDMGEGFFEGLGAGLAGLTDIGGDHFIIKLAAKRYYD